MVLFITKGDADMLLEQERKNLLEAIKNQSILKNLTIVLQ